MGTTEGQLTKITESGRKARYAHGFQNQQAGYTKWEITKHVWRQCERPPFSRRHFQIHPSPVDFKFLNGKSVRLCFLIVSKSSIVPGLGQLLSACERMYTRHASQSRELRLLRF